MKDLTFLTRDACVNTPDLVNNLDDALTALKLPKDYQFVNISKLPPSDIRTVYPTPTVLWRVRTNAMDRDADVSIGERHNE